MEVLKEVLVYVSGLAAVAVVGTLLPFLVRWLRAKGEAAKTNAKRSLFYLGSAVADSVASSLRPVAEDYKARTEDKKLSSEDITKLQVGFHKAWKVALGEFAEKFTVHDEVTYREAAVDAQKHPEV